MTSGRSWHAYVLTTSLRHVRDGCRWWSLRMWLWVWLSNAELKRVTFQTYGEQCMAIRPRRVHLHTHDYIWIVNVQASPFAYLQLLENRHLLGRHDHQRRSANRRLPLDHPEVGVSRQLSWAYQSRKWLVQQMEGLFFPAVRTIRKPEGYLHEYYGPSVANWKFQSNQSQQVRWLTVHLAPPNFYRVGIERGYRIRIPYFLFTS